MLKAFKLIIVVFVIFLSPVIFAKKFMNSYISFDLPSNWKCRMEGTESVCFNRFNKKAKEAIIILTAKEAGPNDNVNYFYSYLKKPRTLPNRNKAPMMSKVVHVKNRMIQNHNWIDALHMSSEVESYYTRYLASIKGQLAILVTFSAHKKYYTRYSMEFLNAIKSLKVIASNKNLSRKSTQPRHRAAPMGNNINFTSPDVGENEFANKKSGDDDFNKKLIAVFLIISAAVLFLFTRKKKKKRK